MNETLEGAGGELSVVFFHAAPKAEIYLNRTTKYLARELPTHWAVENREQFENTFVHGRQAWSILHVAGDFLADSAILETIRDWTNSEPQLVLAVESDEPEATEPSWVRGRAVWQRTPRDIDEWLAMMWELIGLARKKP